MDDCLRPSTGGQRILVGAARLLERVGVVLSSAACHHSAEKIADDNAPDPTIWF